MMQQIITIGKKNLPLTIANVTWESPALNIHGKNWAFFTLESWRLATSNRMVVGSGDDDLDIHKALKEIQNEKIVSINFQSKNLIVDPAFILSNNYILEVFSSCGFEPWTLRLPTGDITFVASPSDPNFTNKTDFS